MNKNEPIHVPFTKAGEMAFDVIREVIINVHARAAAKIDDYIVANFPESEPISATHKDRKYCRTIRLRSGETRTVTYDYRTKEIAVVE